MDPCIHIPHGPSWPVMGISLPYLILIILIIILIIIILILIIIIIIIIWIPILAYILVGNIIVSIGN